MPRIERLGRPLPDCEVGYWIEMAFPDRDVAEVFAPEGDPKIMGERRGAFLTRLRVSPRTWTPR